MNKYNIVGIIICALICLFHIPYFINPAKKLSNFSMITSLYAASFIFFNVIVLYKDSMMNHENGLDLLPFYMVTFYSVFTFVHMMIALIVSRHEQRRSNQNNLLGNYLNANEYDDMDDSNKYFKNIRKCFSSMSPFYLSLAIIGFLGLYTGLITYYITCHIEHNDYTEYTDYTNNIKDEEKGICFSWARVISFAASLVVLIQYAIGIKQSYFSKADTSLYNYHNMQFVMCTMILLWLLNNDLVEYSTWMPFSVLFSMNVIFMFTRIYKTNNEIENVNSVDDFQL